MGNKARIVLISMLVLPVFVYILFVYGLKDVFFETLPYVKMPVVVNGTPTGDTVAYEIPEFEFTDQDGRLITRDSVLGKVYVAGFFFANCPTICPAMNFNLLQIQKRFSGFDDFMLLSHTVDPDRDSVQALQTYAKRLGANTAKWKFVTGEKAAIYATAQAYFLNAYEDQLAPGGFLHSQSVVLVDWEGKIRSRKDDFGNMLGAYDVLQATQLNDLEEDIKVLMAEYERYKHNLEKK